MSLSSALAIESLARLGLKDSDKIRHQEVGVQLSLFALYQLPLFRSRRRYF